MIDRHFRYPPIPSETHNRYFIHSPIFLYVGNKLFYATKVKVPYARHYNSLDLKLPKNWKNFLVQYINCLNTNRSTIYYSTILFPQFYLITDAHSFSNNDDIHANAKKAATTCSEKDKTKEQSHALAASLNNFAILMDMGFPKQRCIEALEANSRYI